MQCDHCAYYEYDEEDETWYCGVDMDEDDLYRFMQAGNREGPYFRNDDEYEVVKHQM